MQIRLWGTETENKEAISILQNALGERIKIISPPYPSKGNPTKRIYLEVNLGFSEETFFKDIARRK